MECVFGLVGDGFALIAADTSAVHSILVHKSNEDKVMILDSHKLLGASDEGGDRVQFTEYIQKNVLLYQFQNDIPLTTATAANFTRGELTVAFWKPRKRTCVCASPSERGEYHSQRPPTPLLDTINYPIHMKNLSMKELKQLSDELRSDITSMFQKPTVILVRALVSLS